MRSGEQQREWLWRDVKTDQGHKRRESSRSGRRKEARHKSLPSSYAGRKQVVDTLEDEVLWLDEQIKELRRHINSAVIVPLPRVKVMVPGNYGRLLTVSQHAESTMYLWRVNDGRRLASLRGHQDIVTAVAILPGIEQCIVSGSADCTMKVWSAFDGRCITTLRGHEGSVTCLTVASPGNRYIVSGSADCTVKVWRASDWECLGTLRGHTSPVQAVAVLPQGDRVVSFAGKGNGSEASLKVWRISDGKCVKTLLTGNFDMHGGIQALAGGDRILSLPKLGSPRMWSLADAQAAPVLPSVESINHSRAPGYVTLQGGNLIASIDSTDPDVVKIWSVTEGVCIKTMPGHQALVSTLAVLPGSAFVASAAVDGEIRIWRLLDSREVVRLSGHPGPVGIMVALK